MTDKKIALVTGGAKGIGRAIVEALVANGYFVYFTYNTSLLLAEELESTINRGDKHLVQKMHVDITREDMVEKMVAKIEEENGEIDVLVNNAGVALSKLFTDCNMQDYQTIFGVNVFGTFLVTKHVARTMVRKHSGKIINITSIWGDCGGSFETVYSASKASLTGFTKALAKELGPSNVTVNAISPGFIKTDMTKCYTDEVIKSIEDEIPLMRVGDAEEVAKAVIFLANSEYVTGQTLSVNGGWNI